MIKFLNVLVALTCLCTVSTAIVALYTDKNPYIYPLMIKTDISCKGEK